MLTAEARPRNVGQLITLLQGGTEELTKQSLLVSRLSARIEATSELVAEMVQTVGELHHFKTVAEQLTDLSDRFQQSAILIAAISEDQRNRISVLEESPKSEEERVLAARTIGQAEQALEAATLALALSP
ncbi:hypothetical protein BESB_073410 [Besnoitia besnoiti]|uniref:Uncharacterized protein n=1 Tax=Besnoitia besnoiti TaxID=94643 RepID=A0A2A9M8E4_BESBE|nr:uncharacterized protein BESB_073410 [Besnoitia besnoiti]PFH34189.1 hypothetical protein BESB_073410 [Besnoitia besnoiti]